MELAAKLDRLDHAAEALRQLVESAPDPSITVAATPAWSIAQVYAHVAAEVPRYEADARGVGERVADAGDLAAENLRLVASLDTDVRATAEGLRTDLASLRATLEGFGIEQPVVRFDGGTTMRADTALGALLGEFLVHGHDIAGIVGRPWKVDLVDVPPILDALSAVLPGWVDPASATGHSATYEVRVGTRHRIYEFTDGALVVDPSQHRRIDVHIRMRPRAAILAMYMRGSPLRMALRGDVRAWGRKPWLARRFASLFHAP